MSQVQRVADQTDMKQNPVGRAFFRNYKNELVDVKLDSLRGLGEWIAQQDDSYICSAKRYISFLTGMDTNSDEALNKFGVSEGLKLRKHQSLARLIENVVASPYYIRRNQQ